MLLLGRLSRHAMPCHAMSVHEQWDEVSVVMVCWKEDWFMGLNWGRYGWSSLEMRPRTIRQ